ncbi:hypothetical protein HDU76_008016 [Blyttiomyces sp. JEL0837]|nr:hypothetical protein HDU76_008016 [Blyttiomyces sp. JEL0837]
MAPLPPIPTVVTSATTNNNNNENTIVSQYMPRSTPLTATDLQQGPASPAVSTKSAKSATTKRHELIREETAESLLKQMKSHDFHVAPEERRSVDVVSEDANVHSLAVLGLLLVFRTNTAYDRYWEGRKLWSSLITHARNLARGIWIGVNTKGIKQNENEKRGAVNLTLAYVVAVKHYLRGEREHKFTDLAHLLAHVPRYHPEQDHNDKNLPIDINLLLTDYCRRARAAGI